MRSTCLYMMLMLMFCLLEICISEPFLNEECPRIRKPVDESSTDELMLYVEGLQAIRANGKYQVIIDAHQEQTAIHRGSSFFFYHTYYVHEVETQIRKLGGKYKCFALPYYDWTVDAGKESDPFILNSVFGGDGDPDNSNCVMSPSGLHSGNWDVQNWPIHELCSVEEKGNEDIGCCLKRDLYPESKLGNATQIGSVVELVDFQQFEEGVAFEHQKVHWLFGKGDECLSCAMATGYSPDDPLFMVLHSYTAYLRVLWAACHGYDVLTAEELEDNPSAYRAFCSEGYDECGTIELDDPYKFGGMVNQPWSITSTMKVTPRKMWDFSAWNVVYDAGHFPLRSGLMTDSEICSQSNLRNSKWIKWGQLSQLDIEAMTNDYVADHQSTAATKVADTVVNDKEDLWNSIKTISGILALTFLVKFFLFLYIVRSRNNGIQVVMSQHHELLKDQERNILYGAVGGGSK